jgi:RNA polymerase sigma-70 factor (ECF subfamily)
LQKKEEFITIYESHKDLVYNVCLNYLQNKEEAEEVFQDVFLKVHAKLNDFNQQSSYKTWIYRICINKCIDYLRAKNRKKRFAFLQSLSNSKLEIHSNFSHPGVLMEDKESMRILFRHINSLPEKQKTAIVLKSIEGLSQKEIAQILSTTEKAVESLLSRARKKLKEKIESSKDDKE